MIFFLNLILVLTETYSLKLTFKFHVSVEYSHKMCVLQNMAFVLKKPLLLIFTHT